MNISEQWRKDRIRDKRINERAARLAEPDGTTARRLEQRAMRIPSGERLCGCFSCRSGYLEVFVYFMREPDGPVKIGITHVGVVSTTVYSVENRRCAVESASGRLIVVLAQIPGSRWSEFELHQRFAHLRTIGEWFRPEPELLDFIASLVRAR